MHWHDTCSSSISSLRRRWGLGGPKGCWVLPPPPPPPPQGKVKRKQMTLYLSKLARNSTTGEGCDLASLRSGGDGSGRSLSVVIVGQLATEEHVPL